MSLSGPLPPAGAARRARTRLAGGALHQQRSPPGADRQQPGGAGAVDGARPGRRLRLQRRPTAQRRAPLPAARRGLLAVLRGLDDALARVVLVGHNPEVSGARARHAPGSLTGPAARWRRWPSTCRAGRTGAAASRLGQPARAGQRRRCVAPAPSRGRRRLSEPGQRLRGRPACARPAPPRRWRRPSGSRPPSGGTARNRPHRDR